MLRRPATVIELQLDTDKAEYEQILRERQLRGQPLPAPTVSRPKFAIVNLVRARTLHMMDIDIDAVAGAAAPGLRCRPHWPCRTAGRSSSAGGHCHHCCHKDRRSAAANKLASTLGSASILAYLLPVFVSSASAL
jgi:hypothetical protein